MAVQWVPVNIINHTLGACRGYPELVYVPFMKQPVAKLLSKLHALFDPSVKLV